jgi:hypothetical protein
MKRERLKSWESFWIVAAVLWVAAVALYAIWTRGIEVERLRFWADSIEWTINADPMVEVSAKELRASLGDEQFIATAPAAYPRVNLKETMQRYEADLARRPRGMHDGLTFIAWALVPPTLLYLLTLLAMRLRAVLRPTRPE